MDFLRFHFDGNFDDSSCTRADARVTEGHVGFARSPRGMAADFTGLGYLDVSGTGGYAITSYGLTSCISTSLLRRSLHFLYHAIMIKYIYLT